MNLFAAEPAPSPTEPTTDPGFTDSAAQSFETQGRCAPLSWQGPPIVAITDALIAGRSCLDASDTGTGKTFVTLFAAKASGKRLAVLCPKSAIPSWREAADAVGVPLEFAVNVEKLKAAALRRPQYLRKLVNKQWQWRLPDNTVLVVDEVHRHAGHNTDNAKILAAAPAPTVMLSATVANSPLGMRAIGSQLNLTTWQDWWRWCLKNGCRPGDFGGLKFVGGNIVLDRIHRQIFHTGRGVRVKVSDLKGIFPDNLVETVSVPVEDAEKLDEAYLEELEALRNDAQNALTHTLRSRQISEHLKLPAMIEMAEDGIAEGKSVAIFVNFRDTLENLASQRWSVRTAVIHGSQTGDEREINRSNFQQDRARLIFVMNQAGGLSLSLHDIRGEFPRLGVHSPGWSARDLLQAMGRLPRAKAMSNVIQRLLFAADTIEERVRKQVLTKAHDIQTLNDGDLAIR